MSGITDTGGFAMHYVGSSGFGFGLTDVNLNSSYNPSDNSSGSSPSTAELPLFEKKINFRALEFSYTLGYLTLGLGSPISGLYTKTEYNIPSTFISSLSIYSITGSTGFATLALDIFDKGSLLIGYHMSSLTFKSSTASAESETISNVMLGFRIPL